MDKVDKYPIISEFLRYILFPSNQSFKFQSIKKINKRKNKRKKEKKKKK